MAVFSSAHGAHSRPGRRLPWHLVLLAFVAAVSMSGPSLLDAPARSSGPPDAFVVSNDGAGVDVANSAAVAEPPDPLLTSLDELMTGLEAPYVAPVGRPAEAVPGTAGTELVAEVSVDPPVVVQAVEAASAPGTVEQTVAPVVPADPAATIGRWASAGIFIETAGQHLDTHSLANVDAALSALPAGVLASLGNPAFGPLHILVNAEGRTLSGDQPYRGPANFFSTNESTNELVLFPQQSVFTIVHELGHAYNLRNVGAGRYALVLLDPEMRGFLTAAGWQVNSTDAEIRTAVDHMHVEYTYAGAFHWPRVSHDDPLEDFANSFATFFLDPETLRQASPERYGWMLATFGR